MTDNLIQTARKLRKKQTPHEIKMWRLLRDRRFKGYKFRRQFPMGRYVADFCCYKNRLIIELDGGQHNLPEQSEHDKDKDNFFKKHGFRVLRIWNNEIDNNLEGIIDRILELLK